MSRLRNRVTQAQVAQRAGVSLATVSRALSGHPLVTPETRQHTLQIVREMGYKPNMAARALASQKSFLIAILCREAYRQSSFDVIQGIQDTLLPSDYSLLVYAHGDQAADEAAHLQLAMDRGVEGLIIYPALDLDGLTNADRLASLSGRVPVLQMLPTLPGIPSIRRHNQRAAYLATQHLIERGHRRIIHLTHPYYCDPELRRFYYDAHERWQGYTQAMAEAGLHPAVVTHRPILGGMNFARAAAEVAMEVLDHSSHPTAVCTYSDFHALGLMQALAGHGVSVPQDLSIVGLDEIPASTLSYPPLTTIRWPDVETGRQAGRTILDLIEGRSVGDTQIEPRLVCRGSVKSLNTESVQKTTVSPTSQAHVVGERIHS